MNLYQWDSKALENYSYGDIIVMAYSPEEAREKARAEIKTWLKEHHRSWWWMVDNKEDVDEDSVDDYNRWMEQFEKDLSKEPDMIGTGVLFITGSE